MESYSLEMLYELIPRDELLNYIENSQDMIYNIIKQKTLESMLEDYHSLPVVVLSKKKNNPNDPIQITICRPGKKRTNLLTWWYNTQKFKQSEELVEFIDPKQAIKCKTYPFYMTTELMLYLKPHMKRGGAMYRNENVYFIEDIYMHMSRGIELDMKELIENIKSKFWSEIYENDMNKERDLASDFYVFPISELVPIDRNYDRDSYEEPTTRRVKPGIDSIDDYF